MNEEVRRLALMVDGTAALREPGALATIRRYVEGFFDAARLETDLKQFGSWVALESAPNFVNRFLDRPYRSNPLIALIWAARQWQEEDQENPPSSLPHMVHRLFDFGLALALAEVRAASFFDVDARHHLQSRLRSHDHAWSVIHECETFITIESWGGNPEPCFLRPGAETDIEAHYQEFVIPVSCKAKYPGTGRLMSRDLFIRLAASLARDISARDTRRAVAVRVTSRLEYEDIPAICRRVRILEDFASNVAVTHQGRLFLLTSRRLEPETLTADNIHQFLAECGHYVGMAFGDARRDVQAQQAAAVVGIDANFSDMPEKTLRSSISKAAAAISRTGRLGIAAVHYFDAQPILAGPSEDQPTEGMAEVFTDAFNRHQKLAAILISTEANVPLFGQWAPMKVFTAHRKGLPRGFPWSDL